MQKDSFLENIYELETLWIESKARLRDAEKLSKLKECKKIINKLIKKYE